MRASVLAAAVVFSAAPALAHDFWMEPSSFRPAVGSSVDVRLLVGEKFKGEPVPRNPAKIVQFVMLGPEGEAPVLGRPGDDPAGRAIVAAGGVHVIGYRGNRSSIELEAGKFEKYLASEGLERIIALRAQRDEKGKKGREVYSRCAKALLTAGGEGGAGYDRVLGFTLELVPDKSPQDRGAPEGMPIRILYEGKPLEGALIVALSRDAPGDVISRRSDAEGRAVFPLKRAGVWLVKAVHMVPAPAGTDADWESLWASLIFEIPD